MESKKGFLVNFGGGVEVRLEFVIPPQRKDYIIFNEKKYQIYTINHVIVDRPSTEEEEEKLGTRTIQDKDVIIFASVVKGL